jgi:tRNA (adenine57-N1/adenine58-N1)-methyltransferase
MNTMNQTELDKSIIHEGDLIQLVGPREKTFILTIVAGGEFHTHKGIIRHDDMIGKQWGTLVTSHTGINFLMLQPALDDITRNVKRTTQIMYPKDIGYILVSLGISPGNHGFGKCRRSDGTYYYL